MAASHSRLLRHIPPPSRFLESYLQEGTLFFAPCQVVPLYYFTSFRRAIWLFLPERCASRLRVEVAFANQAAVDGPRRRRVRRGLHYSWAVILADLCTGEPVDGCSVVILSGMLSAVPHSRLLRHKPIFLGLEVCLVETIWSTKVKDQGLLYLVI